MAEDLNIKIVAGKDADKKIRKMVKNLQSRWEPHAKAGDYMEKQVIRAYNRQQTLGKGKWQGLSEETLRSRKFPGKPPLVQTGRLRRSIIWTVLGTTRSGLGAKILGPGAVTVTRISPEKAGSGRRSIKARVHQGGATRSGTSGKVRIPARPYLGLSKINRDKIQKIFADWIENQIKKAVR